MPNRRNGAGYMDLTAFYAIRNADREYKKDRGGRENKSKPQGAKSSSVAKPAPNPKTAAPQSNYHRIYICSPYSGDTERNTANATRFCRFALKMRMFPIAPHLFLPHFMDDAIPVERELALNFGLRLLYGCKEIWVFGDRISVGMKNEIAEAKRKCITIRYFTDNCEDVTNTI